jgi:hypothetical protein
MFVCPAATRFVLTAKYDALLSLPNAVSHAEPSYGKCVRFTCKHADWYKNTGLEKKKDTHFWGVDSGRPKKKQEREARLKTCQ